MRRDDENAGAEVTATGAHGVREYLRGETVWHTRLHIYNRPPRARGFHNGASGNRVAAVIDRSAVTRRLFTVPRPTPTAASRLGRPVPHYAPRAIRFPATRIRDFAPATHATTLADLPTRWPPSWPGASVASSGVHLPGTSLAARRSKFNGATLIIYWITTGTSRIITARYRSRHRWRINGERRGGRFKSISSE